MSIKSPFKLIIIILFPTIIKVVKAGIELELSVSFICLSFKEKIP